MRSSGLAMLALLLAACSGRQTGAGLQVNVELSAKSKATCVRVTATSDKSTATTAPIPRGSKSSLKVGVNRSAELDGTVQLIARGFVAPDCSEASFNEDSAPVSATFVDGKIVTVTVSLDGPRNSDDDGDGYRIGVDCNDAVATINPGRAETCGNRVDDNCNAKTDCDEDSCNGNPCDDGDGCTINDLCDSSRKCVPGNPLRCDMPGLCQDAGYCDAGSCVYPISLFAPCQLGSDAGRCNLAGACFIGEILCDDGRDDDSDQFFDCDDPDCEQQHCDAGQCRVGGSCASGSCGGSTPFVCPPAAGGCLAPTACDPDAGCLYVPLGRGASCDAGSCRDDGGCGPVESGAQCMNAIDDDDDGLLNCADPSCAAAACDDGNICTVGETCNSGGCDAGTNRLMCTMPAVCQTATGAVCLAPAIGCYYYPDPAVVGDACDAGAVCRTDGLCAPGFPYPPSNFVEGAIRRPLSSVRIECTASIWFDTDSFVFSLDRDGSVPLFDAGIPAPDGGTICIKPPFEISSQAQLADGGDPITVLAAHDIVMPVGNTLLVKGSRPVVFAAFGDVLIEGLIQAGFDADAVAAGASTAADPKAHCAVAAGGDGDDQSDSAGGGAGASYGSLGASGGSGNGTGGNTSQGGAPGALIADTRLTPLRGGCHGGGGGPQATQLAQSSGGWGGGAIQISAAGTLRVIGSGTVSAPGRGGRGGNNSNNSVQAGGGGGGGSGGAILLEALHLHVTGYVTANGGAGGEGDGDSSDNCCDGYPGNRGSLVSAAPAVNVPNPLNPNGGNGGDGASATAAAVAGQSGGAFDHGCGGGGGGGLGRVFMRGIRSCTITDAGVLSPAPATLCP